MFWRATFTAKALAVMCCLPGCQSLLVQTMSQAPNHGRTITPADESTWFSRFVGASRQMAVEVGPPEATLRCWVFEPKTHAPPKATVLVLHGYLMNSFWMLTPAKHLTKAGYRVVAVDSRGHGGSSGHWVGYGGQESRDLVHVIDRLEREGLIADGRLGVFGISMGASTAVQVTAIEPRIDSAVALAPFTSYNEVAPHATRGLIVLPIPWWSDEDLREAMRLADERSPLNIAEADPLAAAPDIRVPTLLLNGPKDHIIPPDHSVRIAAANPTHITHVSLEGKGHFLITDWKNEYMAHTVRWFDEHLADIKKAK